MVVLGIAIGQAKHAIDKRVNSFSKRIMFAIVVPAIALTSNSSMSEWP